MNYGLPYQGSKSAIAEWLVGVLPESHTLVDLFAGGCAVTHAAIASGKFEHVMANDITAAPRVFASAIAGDFEGYATVPERSDFFETDDMVIRLLYSFGNDKSSYLWSPEIEGLKVAASKMLSAPSLHERRMHFKEFCERLGGGFFESMSNAGDLERLKKLQGLEGLERLQSLERIQGVERLEVFQSDYRLVQVPAGATVYADPPYRSTANSRRYTGEGAAFDFEAFDSWLASVPFPVFVSEYDAPAGCIEYAATTRSSSMAAITNVKRVERVYIQDRFASEIASMKGTLF